MSTKPFLQSVPGSTEISESNHVPSVQASASSLSDGSAGAPPSSNGGGGRAPGKARPQRSVPTDRMRFEKQVATLQTYAQLSGRNKQPVSADYLGQALEMSPATAGLCGGFFKDSGWLERSGRAYTATDALLEYQRRINLDPEHGAAVKYLADGARSSWYWEAVEPMLGAGVRLNMLLVTLSQAANAHDHKPQLLLLIEWMTWLGLIQRDGDMVYPVSDVGEARLSPPTPQSPDSEGAAGPSLSELDDSATSHGGSVQPDGSDDARQPSPTTPSFDPGALVSFNFSVRITAEDAMKLSTENIASVLEVVERLRR